MSGHSKWATIKRAKGANDAKRGKLFTKLSMAITIAVREGGGIADPNGNPRLRLAVDAARAANMPKDNIDRAIQRASGKQASEMEEVVYEGFGPGGFSLIVEAITDNKQRTTPEVKNIIEKNGGSLGNMGSVAYQFQQKGLISLEKSDKTLDDIFLIAADAGAEDIEDAGEEIIVYTEPEDLGKVRDSLIEHGVVVKSSELFRKPSMVISLDDIEVAKRALAFVEKLEEMDDVQKVYANYDIPDAVFQMLE
jgi:YebC/PmpR family DNA-binding regulatory protein